MPRHHQKANTKFLLVDAFLFTERCLRWGAAGMMVACIFCWARGTAQSAPKTESSLSILARGSFAARATEAEKEWGRQAIEDWARRHPLIPESVSKQGGDQ